MTTFKVNGMMCAHCQKTVEKVLAAIGAADAKVDLSAGTVQCAITPTVTEKAVRKAITDAGYEVE